MLVILQSTRSIIVSSQSMSLLSHFFAFILTSATGVSGSFANGLALDRTSSNLYYTSASFNEDGSGFKGVSVISPKGDNRVIVSGGYIPKDIVLDPSEGLMFWTDQGAVPTVKQANMDGTKITVIIQDDIYLPSGIAIDYQAKMLYVTDGGHNTIQNCTYLGYCTTVHTEHGAFLRDIELYGQYLYYTAWNRSYIIKMNKHIPADITHLATNAEFGRLDSISIYSSSARKQPGNLCLEVNDKCFPNKGLGVCSTLCLPTSYGKTCACQDGVSFWLGSTTVCEDIPKCSRTIENGQMWGSCSYLHHSQCSYSCNANYRSATEDSLLSCANGQWSLKTPCIFAEDTTSTTTAAASTATTATSSPSEGASHQPVVFIAAGAGCLVAVVIIVVLLYVVVRRYAKAKNGDNGDSDRPFADPNYIEIDDLSTLSSSSAQPGVSQGPDSTYMYYGFGTEADSAYYHHAFDGNAAVERVV